MGTSVLHIKTEVECRVYLFDEEKGIAKPGTYFNLEVRKGEQDLLFVSTEDETARCQLLYTVEENDCDYRLSLERSQFKQYSKEVNTAKATDEEIANGFEDEYGVVYSADGTELLKCCNVELEYYQVKEGCKVIRGSAFSSNPSDFPIDIKTITLPTSLTHIGDEAFSFCYHLTSITLPATLTHIGRRTFGCCKNLSTITLPASLTHIGDGAFAGTGIRSVVNHSPNFTFQKGYLIDVQCNRLIAFLSDDEEVTLPATLTQIGDSVFYDCENLTAITLPATLTHIGRRAFWGCVNLTAITLPAGLTHIRNETFCYCKNLTAITLPATLTHIGDEAFSFCYHLTSITLPATLTHIGDEVFCYCENLTAITLPATLTHIGRRAFWGCKNLSTITLPASLTHIGDGAFADTGIRSVVNHSPNFTFQEGYLIDVQCQRLLAFLSDDEEVTLPATLTQIGDSVFYGCENLTAITLPAGLTHIGNDAFCYCKNLIAITLPSSLTHIGDMAFRYCKRLTAITLPASLKHIGDGTFWNCNNLTVITLPANLTHIGNQTFSGCLNLTTITLPTSLAHIGDRAFYQCKNLTTITLPATLTHIGFGVFEECNNLTAITLPTSLTYIGDGAFWNCNNLTVITLPTSLTHIGDKAFAWSGIRSVVNNSPHFTFREGCLIDVQGKKLISFLSDDKEVTLPTNLTLIGDFAFAGCWNLTTITLPTNLTRIGSWAFDGCKNLTTISLPTNLTHIGSWAFEACKNLTTIYVPKGMREYFKALLPPDLHSKLKELESLSKSPEGPFSRLNLQDLENFLNASVKPKLFEPVNALPGQFTINANGTKVRFSMGNLQYQAATRTWHFAEHQWEWVGDANSFTNNGWIDLFEFGSGYNPMSASYYYYHNRNFCDWGGNAISNGGNTPNIWRTLTADEWIYLLKTRAGASAKMATGNIDGVHGLILLPDSWTQPSGCSFNAGFADEENDWTHNTYTLAQWTMMENAGAVFLPAAGKLLSGSVIHVGEFGSYWSSTPHHDYEASSVKFRGDSVLVMSSDSYDDGLSVRVVIEVSKL